MDFTDFQNQVKAILQTPLPGRGAIIDEARAIFCEH